MQILSKNINAKSPQGDSIYYPYVIRKQSSFVYWTDHNTGINWGTDIDANIGNIVLNSTDQVEQMVITLRLEDGTEWWWTYRNGKWYRFLLCIKHTNKIRIIRWNR